jgi:hypothetical protein
VAAELGRAPVAYPCQRTRAGLGLEPPDDERVDRLGLSLQLELAELV